MPAGRKYDDGKAPLFQGCIAYFTRALHAVANISKYGKEKYAVEYADKNWQKVPEGIDRYTNADARHLASESVDGLHDPESGYLHAAHHAWNALARLELLLKDGTPLRVRLPTAWAAGGGLIKTTSSPANTFVTSEAGVVSTDEYLAAISKRLSK